MSVNFNCKNFISIKDFYSNGSCKYTLFELQNNKKVWDNLIDLQIKVNNVFQNTTLEIQISNAYRSMLHHLQIYKDNGVLTQKDIDLYINDNVLPTKNIPLKSLHLTGEAFDIIPLKNSKTTIKDIHNFILSPKGLELIDKQDLYIENLLHTKTWLHIQSKAFGSYIKNKENYDKLTTQERALKRFFNP
jgi:hypothetical protein